MFKLRNNFCKNKRPIQTPDSERLILALFFSMINKNRSVNAKKDRK